MQLGSGQRNSRRLAFGLFEYSGMRTAAERFRELDVAAVAVCFLHSYANPAHEKRLADLIAEGLRTKLI